jgi:ATP-dependent Clp protease ATP-binding subunit ClpA
MAKFDKSTISVKREALEKVSAQLKTEFFGLDEIIDKVVKSIHAWYIFPEIITRPVIINLWGMTGVGKTQLVRRLVSLLDYQRRFVEIQMDGGSMKSNHDSSSISKILSESSIDEGQPGILSTFQDGERKW